MRNCLRCGTEMVENLNISASNGGYGLDVREKGAFKNALGRLKCAVCPECGYAEAYMEKTEGIKALSEKSK